MILAIFGFALLGVAVALLVGQLLPSRTRLAEGMESFGGSTEDLSSDANRHKEKLGRWAMANIPAQLGKTASRSDLALLGINEVDHYYRKLVYAVAGVLLSFIFGLYSNFLNLPYLVFPMVLGPILAWTLWRTPDQTVTNRAATARKEFSRGIGTFIELVAAEMNRNGVISVAINHAAKVSDSWIFQRIRQSLERATLSHKQPWDALTDLADEIDSPELIEAANVMSLSGEKGAQIYSTLRATGRTLRMRELAAEHDEANKKSSKLDVKIVQVSLVFIGVMITGLLLNFN